MDNKKVRADISATIQGVNYSISYIVKDGYTYTWGSMINGGIKTKSINDDGTQVIGKDYAWNPAYIKNYSCKPWTTEKSKFELPQGITFN
jgi:hypothetical protein